MQPQRELLSCAPRVPLRWSLQLAGGIQSTGIVINDDAPSMFPTMMSGGTQPEGPNQTAPTANPTGTSCRRNKLENTSFVSDIKDHIHEFIHASADEHKTCLTRTIRRMFVMAKVVTERSAEANEAGGQSVLPLQTSVSQQK